MEAKANTSPLVIIGVDAGDVKFITRWVQEGYLPSIASIMQRGCWGQTTGPELVSEHGVWVSLFSGISRSQHGYYYYRQLKPGTYDLEAVTGLDIDAPPFWSQFRARNKKVAIIDVPDSAPIRGLPGIQLAHWATHDSWDREHYRTASEPPQLLQDVYGTFGPRLPTLEKHDSTSEEDRQIYRQLLDHVEKKGALCRDLLARERFDLAVTVFAESHAANHQFWKYRPEAQNGQKQTKHELANAIRNVYQAIDRQMGLLLAQLPREANLFIVSSVGMEDNYPTTGLIDAFCRQLGYQAPAESKGVSLRPLDLVRRIVPETWRIALSRHLSREQRERLLADQFRSGTNWTKTTAFAIPTPYTSFVRVNLRGREPEGIIAPGAEYRALLNRIEADLQQLVDQQTNERAVKRIGRTVDLFGCEPHVSLPDLFIEWKPGRFMERVVHPATDLVQRKPDWYRPSDHSSSGFVAAAGPSVRKLGALGDVQVLDLAPTFLSLMGEHVPENFTGQAMKDVIGS
jgi:predicted AlkP superfamily phosphohydrolase/phosphomutase